MTQQNYFAILLRYLFINPGMGVCILLATSYSLLIPLSLCAKQHNHNYPLFKSIVQSPEMEMRIENCICLVPSHKNVFGYTVWCYISLSCSMVILDKHLLLFVLSSILCIYLLIAFSGSKLNHICFETNDKGRKIGWGE